MFIQLTEEYTTDKSTKTRQSLINLNQIAKIYKDPRQDSKHTIFENEDGNPIFVRESLKEIAEILVKAA